MLSIIEQEMCSDDGKVWSRDERKEKKQGNFRATDELNGCRDETTYSCYCPIEI